MLNVKKKSAYTVRQSARRPRKGSGLQPRIDVSFTSLETLPPRSSVFTFVSRRPAKSQRVCRFIELALDQILAATVIKAEHLVVGIENVSDKGEALRQQHASLHIDLQVRIEVGVAVRTLETSWRRRGSTRTILILIREDVRVVVRNSEAVGETAAVIRGADIPGIWRLPQQVRMVQTPRYSARARKCVSIICRKAESAEPSWERAKVLHVRDFHAK